jgi:hypothetical protein
MLTVLYRFRPRHVNGYDTLLARATNISNINPSDVNFCAFLGPSRSSLAQYTTQHATGWQQKKDPYQGI